MILRELSKRSSTMKNMYIHMNAGSYNSSPATSIGNTSRLLHSAKWQRPYQFTARSSRVTKISANANITRSLVTTMFPRAWCNSLTSHIYTESFINVNGNRYIYDNSSVYAISPRKKSIIRRIIHKLKSIARALMNAILVAIRSSEIAIRLSPLMILTPAAIFSAYKSNPGSGLAANKASDMAWDYTLYTIQSLGPAFVKICQWAATRRDLFPQHICDRLSKLHDATLLHSWKHTHETLTNSFGGNYHMDLDDGTDLYFKKRSKDGGLKIDPNNVIGSGAVAQVYKGSLTHNGVQKLVAVKVLHPNIHTRIERDLSLMTRVAELIHSLPSDTIQMMNLPRVCANFAQVMEHQIDLRNEAKHLHLFRANFAVENNNEKIAKVSFPRPILSDTNCLIEDYEDALPMSEYLNDESAKGMELRKKLAGPLLRSFLKVSQFGVVDNMH